jgi:protein-arginine kinase activator protein McsA
MYEKSESCPKCGTDFKQAEYDGQFCCACGWQHGEMRLADLKEEILTTMKHARTFITSREKMHPTGVELYDELIEKISNHGIKTDG